LILILLIALPVRYMIERIKPFEQKSRNPDWIADLRKLNDRNIKKGVLFNFSRPIEVMFYSNVTAYGYMPDRLEIVDLCAEGYTVLINDDGNLTEDIKSIDGIIIEKFKCQ
jgi:hypothetical protein